VPCFFIFSLFWSPMSLIGAPFFHFFTFLVANESYWCPVFQIIHFLGCRWALLVFVYKLIEIQSFRKESTKCIVKNSKRTKNSLHPKRVLNQLSLFSFANFHDTFPACKCMDSVYVTQCLESIAAIYLLNLVTDREHP